MKTHLSLEDQQFNYIIIGTLYDALIIISYVILYFS